MFACWLTDARLVTVAVHRGLDLRPLYPLTLQQASQELGISTSTPQACMQKAWAAQVAQAYLCTAHPLTGQPVDVHAPDEKEAMGTQQKL